ncbi:MAG: hypothetical protein HRF50_17750 [Phycisphaerae bacterium]|jgi:hypothetical protein
MKLEQRVEAVAAHGFTQRQARFLVTVMLHSGVCMRRHYSEFAGLVHGQKTREFFDTLVSRRFATAYPCAHGRARLFHIHHRRLYDAIGEPDNRNRRPTPLPRAIERLMLLDAVMAAPGLTWLGTERDKLEHFTLLLRGRLERHELPRLVFDGRASSRTRYFPDKLPIGIDADGQTHVFAYLVTRSAPVDFRQFLHRHAELLRALPRWTVRLVIPGHLAQAAGAYESAWREELGAPLRPGVVEELRWYFEQRRRVESAAGERREVIDEPRFRAAGDAFRAPRFRALYRSWIRDGDRVIDAACSPVLADAIARHAGRLERQVLAHRYLHLSPLVATA